MLVLQTDSPVEHSSSIEIIENCTLDFNSLKFSVENR